MKKLFCGAQLEEARSCASTVTSPAAIVRSILGKEIRDFL
jgi:hypothetical protein